MIRFENLKKRNPKTILYLGSGLLLLVLVFVLSQIVLAKNGNGGFQIKTSYIEIQETDYPEYISLIKKEKGKEKVTGQVKIVDQYLISDLPENEFLDEYSNLKLGFQALSISLEADEPLFNKENFYHPHSLFEKTKSFFGFETLPEYRITKEIDKSASVQTELDLQKIKIGTHYEELGIENNELAIKQTLTFTNNSEQDLNLSLLLKNQIEADKIYWDNQEYVITKTPQRFVNPDRVSFNIENGKAFYDFSDVPEEFEPELWAENKGGANNLLLSLNVPLSAGETKTIDPTYGVELTILNVHSHPQAGDYWTVSFKTIGTADLIVTPDDQVSIDDLDFVSLTCDGEEKIEDGPLTILEGDVIFYPSWSCEGTGKIIHLVNVARPHTLKFQFSDETAYAYNDSDEFTSSGAWDCPVGVTSVDVECWGGGGGGGGADSLSQGASGGGGGGYAKTIGISVTPETPYNVVVGALGGAGWNSDGGDAGDSYFDDGTLIKAKGGLGGDMNGALEGYGGGVLVANTGDTVHNGGNGGTCASLKKGGGGGGGGAGSGGSGGAGGIGDTSTGGAGGTAGTGTPGTNVGGAGGATTNHGVTGTAPGGAGGGSGARLLSPATYYWGGNGTAGKCVLTYTPVSVPTVTTQAVSDISYTTSTGNGDITDTGIDETCDLRGFVWDTATHTDPGNIAPADSDYYDAVNTYYVEAEGSFPTGTFTGSLTGLSTSTTYYVRAYAHNSEGYAYGDEVYFDTKEPLPTVTTQAVSDIGTSLSTGNGNITDTGIDETCDLRGFVWGTTTHTDPGNTAPADSDYYDAVNTYYVEAEGSFPTGTFTGSLTGLSASTTYYVRAYAHNSEGYAYGDEVYFDTEPLPTVTTQAVSDVGQTSATGNGNITNTGGDETCDLRGFVWDTESHNDPLNVAPADSDYYDAAKDYYVEESNGHTTGAYTGTLSTLEPGTKYYVRAYAHNLGGYAYGNEVSFYAVYLDPDVQTQVFCAGYGQEDVPAGVTNYNAIETGFYWDSREYIYKQIIPIAGKLRKLRVELTAAPGWGESIVFTVRKNGADTDIACTISDIAISCEYDASEVTVAANDTICLKSVASAGIALTSARWTLAFKADDPSKSMILGAGNTHWTGGTQFVQLASCTATAGSGIEPWVRDMSIPTHGTIKNLKVSLNYLPPGTTTSDGYSFTLRKNGADTALTCTIMHPAVWCEDNTHEVDVEPYDLVALEVTDTGTVNHMNYFAESVVFEPDIVGETLLLSQHISSAPPSQTASEYMTLMTPILDYPSWDTNESYMYQLAQACVLKKFYVQLKGAPGAGKSYTFKVRKNGVDTDLQVVIAGTDTAAADNTHSVTVADGDELSLKCTPYATPAYTQGQHWSLVQYFEPNAAPNATSVSDSPDPVAVGSNVTFTGEWTEADSGDNVKMYICDSSSCTNCTYNSTSSCWCYSDDWVVEPTTTDSCVYTAQSSDFGENDYWLGVCDDSDDCDATPYSGGTFTVATSTYDFTTGTSTDKWAFECGTSSPADPTDYEREATGAEYIAIESSDNSWWTTATATIDSEYDSQIYSITINEATSSISNITIEWEGYGETESSYNTTLYAWNTSTSAWVNLDSIDFTTTTDQTLSGTISSSIEDYIDSNSKLHILASTEKYVAWVLNQTTCNALDGWHWYTTNGRSACWSKTLADTVSWNKGVGDDADNPGAYTCATTVTALEDRMIAVAAGEWYKIVSNINSRDITSADNGSTGWPYISALAVADCVDKTRELCSTNGCLGDSWSTINTSLRTWAGAAGKSALPYLATDAGTTQVTNDYWDACVQSGNEDGPLGCTSGNNYFHLNRKVCDDGDTNYSWGAACGNNSGGSWDTRARLLANGNCTWQANGSTSPTSGNRSFRVVVASP